MSTSVERGNGGDNTAVEVINPSGNSPVVLACEHASNVIPHRYGDLGLDHDALESHVAWDPGALAVAKFMSASLDAPLVAARVSRLVYDCNRPPDAIDAMPAKSERYVIPGNQNLSEAEKTLRTAEVYEPFHTCLTEVLAAHPTEPTLVTIHSFVPVYMGKKRCVQIGLVHDDDDQLAQALLPRVQAQSTFKTALNEPYGPKDGVTHLLTRHGVAAGRPNVMIEISNDLISTEQEQRHMADVLCSAISQALVGLQAATAKQVRI